MFDKFVDELRMALAKSRVSVKAENEIRKRLKPKMMRAASQGKAYVEFAYNEDAISPTAAFVKNHWEEVKTYFEGQGLTCQEVNPNTFVISWE